MDTPRSPPQIVGRYHIFDVIAFGGMASVHLGRLMGPAGFSRTVAIKRLHQQFARDPEFVAMFLDEARLVARIRHPNVVPTLDIVALDDEFLIVMDYVAGESLSTLLKLARLAAKPPPIPVIVDIMVNVLHGLQAAHEATNEKGEPLNIVHRDVSPQNILVGTDGVARVLDFGVAKAVGQMHQTRSGQVKGKIHYMAPEQLACKGMTHSADLYAVSVVLWEALAGKRMFSGDSDAQVMYQVLQETVDPPSSLQPDVPRALDEIVLRGLEKNPGDRYPTAMAMAMALEAAVPPVSRSAVAEWVRESARDSIQRLLLRVASVENDKTPEPTALRFDPASTLPGTRGSASISSTPIPESGTRQSLSQATRVEGLRLKPRFPRFGVVAFVSVAVMIGSVALSIAARSDRALSDAPVAPAAVTAAVSPVDEVSPGPKPAPPPSPAAAVTASASAIAASPRPARAKPAVAPLRAQSAPPKGTDRLYQRD